MEQLVRRSRFRLGTLQSTYFFRTSFIVTQ